MSHTVSNVVPQGTRWQEGPLAVSLVDVEVSSSAAGGEEVTPASVDLSEFYFVEPQVDAADLGGYVAQWNYSTGKLVFYEAGADGAALDAVSGLSGTVRVKFTGRGA